MKLKPGQVIPVEKVRFFELKPGDRFIFTNETLIHTNQIKTFFGICSYITKGKAPEAIPKGVTMVWKLI